LKGGIQFVMQAQCPPQRQNCDKAQYMSAVIDNINRRVSQGLGVNGAVVQQEGSDRVVIELPGLKDDQQARELLGQTGQMNVIDTGGSPLQVGSIVQPNQYKVEFTGANLSVGSISAGLDQQTSKPVVTFAFTGDAKSKFAEYTRTHVGQYLTITLDNQVIESAVIQSEIDGQGQITGIPSIDQAQNLSTILKYGALPLPLQLVSEQQLAATLGQQAIQFSIRAALIGLGMVVLFMLVYYRLPGLLADFALVLYALFLFAVIKLLGVTLSLPGIAAMILTVGMAVDANILIFERMKEELRAGRTMSAAIDLGFKRAWPSIRDSNSSTLITCAILYWFGSNFGATLIVGFAINLAIGVAISLFTAVVVTRNFLHLLVFSGIATHPMLYGLPTHALNLPRYRPSERSRVRQPRAVLAGTGAAVKTRDVPHLAPAGDGRNGTTPATGVSSAVRTTASDMEE
ncbi:MAG: protein translocase subunit SecD, partial [Ktedonobacterales bacterium]|nr:protein translocase subunit SecD [Ktedonobacterales bacterium]